MTKKAETFESQMKEMEEILTSLKDSNLKVADIEKLVKRAREIYSSAKLSIEDAITTIEEVN